MLLLPLSNAVAAPGLRVARRLLLLLNGVSCSKAELDCTGGPVADIHDGLLPALTSCSMGCMVNDGPPGSCLHGQRLAGASSWPPLAASRCNLCCSMKWSCTKAQLAASMEKLTVAVFVGVARAEDG
ncbi:hypothetical protein Dimus_017463 [Dionaea muscipula]